MSLHFCEPCVWAQGVDEDEPIPPHICLGKCRRCSRTCECGADHKEHNGVIEHDHRPGHKFGRHTHAYGDFPHTHLFRAICNRDECKDFPSHDIHVGPSD